MLRLIPPTTLFLAYMLCGPETSKAQVQQGPIAMKVAIPVSPLDTETRDLVIKFRSAKQSDQPAIRGELEKLTAQHFDRSHRQRQDELKALEARLEKLKASVTRREQLKEEIVRQRVNDLLNIENPLQWETEYDHKPITNAPIGFPAPPSYPVTAPRVTSVVTVPSGITDPLLLPSVPQSMAFQGMILKVELNGDAEISLGSGDGLELGQKVDVHRSNQKNSAVIGNIPSPFRYIGRLEVVAIQSDRASCKPLPGTRTEFMVTGDQVSLNLEGAPKPAPLSDDLAALQGSWFRDASETAENGPDQVRLRDCWTIDGKLFIATNNGQVKSWGIVSLGQTKTTKFIQIRDFKQIAKTDIFDGHLALTAIPATSRSTCFLYRIQGEQLETQGYGIEEFSSPSSLPTEFGGEDGSGRAYFASVFRRGKESAPSNGRPLKTFGPAK